MTDRAVSRLLEAYPIIYRACRRPERRTQATSGQVSTHQATVLSLMAPAEAVQVSELARRAAVTMSTMSLLVDRLERLGLVRRIKDRKDARRVHVRLTGLGQRIRRSHSLLDPDRVRALLSRLTPTEQDAGSAAMTTLARAARELIGHEAPSTDQGKGESR